MTSSTLPGQFSSIHQMLIHLMESIPEEDAYRSFHPELAPLAWYLGRSIYQETYWLREVIRGDDKLTSRVRALFAPGQQSLSEQWTSLPPRDHLLNWALEIQDENLAQLANPGLLPQHPLLIGERIQHHILQEHHQIYETMLMVLTERRLSRGEESYRPSSLLHSSPPKVDTASVSQGHYRIGAKDDPAAFDNELPPQVVELSSFQIAKQPVPNSSFLRFMEEGGYSTQRYWSKKGWGWCGTRTSHHPHHWRQDSRGEWFGIGLNGPFDLANEDPVMGICQFEANAFVAWIADQGRELSGAVLQHEYQWEVAIRTHAVKEFGRVWEWCSNPFHPYTDFQPASDGTGTTDDFDSNRFTLRGASLHTQRSLRRPSYRNQALPESRHLFSGMRLVLPPKEDVIP